MFISFITIVSHFKFETLMLPLHFYVIAILITLSPLLATIVHKKSQISIDGDIISGFDFLKKQSASFRLNEITSFGIQKARSGTDPHLHFSTKDHLYISTNTAEIRSYLRPPVSNELLYILKKRTGIEQKDRK